MATDEMYRLAYQYKATKLWQLLFDDQMFALKLPDGEIGYCSVMGQLGEHIALGVYAGERGYRTYRLLLDHLADTDEISNMVLLSAQDCLQCSFENKDMLSDEELDEVRDYAGRNGKTLRGRNAFPQFTKYRPGRVPWHFDSETDERRICAALAAATALKEMLRKKKPHELELVSLNENPRKIPMLTQGDQGWEIRFTTLPAPEMVWPAPQFKDELTTVRIRKLKKRGTLECGTIRLPNPAWNKDRPDDAPYFPQALVTMNPATEMLLPPILTDGDHAEEAMAQFAAMIANANTAPQTVQVYDPECYAILEDFCKQTGIGISLNRDMEDFRDALLQMLHEMDDEDNEEAAVEQLDDLCAMLMDMPDEELRQIPNEMVGMLMHLADQNVIPDALARRLRKLF